VIVETNDVLAQASTWRHAGHRVALATVVRTWGSSPRPAGSQLAVCDDGRFVGSVSGGCVEGAVVEAALEVIDSGVPRPLEFGVTNEMAWEVGLACGGQLEIYVQRVPPTGAGATVFDALLEARAADLPVVLATWLDGGAQRLLAEVAGSLPQGLEPELVEAVRESLAQDRSATVRAGASEVFLHVFHPPVRLIVVGAVHISQALVGMARLAGLEVVLVDPRRAFATPERFPEVRLLTAWPDRALADLEPNPRTALVTLTHDPKLDDPALAVALRTGAFYIGALGSSRTHAKRLARLREQGFDEAALARIHGPVGLDIGARTPAEIAVSILADVIAALRAEAA
jgi:xanthine dehydrogenase accessory factor